MGVLGGRSPPNTPYFPSFFIVSPSSGAESAFLRVRRQT